MKFRGPPANMTQTKIEFSNESYIESLPSASDPARGESVSLVVIDELAYLPNSDEAWSSIEPIADIGGRVIALSTAQGEGNLFHTLWVGATTTPEPVQSHVPPVVGERTRRRMVRTRRRRDLPEWQLAQEYPDNPDDAFLKSGAPFSPSKRYAIIKDTVREPIVERLPCRAPAMAVHRRTRRKPQDLGVAGQGRSLRHRCRPSPRLRARRLLRRPRHQRPRRPRRRRLARTYRSRSLRHQCPRTPRPDVQPGADRRGVEQPRSDHTEGVAPQEVSPAVHAALTPIQTFGPHRHPRLAHHPGHQTARRRRTQHGVERTGRHPLRRRHPVRTADIRPRRLREDERLPVRRPHHQPRRSPTR